MIAIKEFLKLIFYLFGFINIRDAVKIYNLPRQHLNRQIINYPNQKDNIEPKEIKLYFIGSSKFLRLKDIHKYKDKISSKDYNFNIIVNEFRFKMNFNGYELDSAIIERINGIRERETTAILKSIIIPEMKIIEIGACYGYFTNIVSKCVGSKGKIFSIESSPNNFEILNNNIILNNLSNVKSFNYFVANNNNKILFNKNARNSYSIEVIKNGNQEKNKDQIIVDSISLSKFIYKNHFNPDIIFMDIEGSEIELLEDLHRNYFTKHRPIILFEIHEGLYEKNKSIDYIKDLLIKNKYYSIEIRGNLLNIPMN